jgi:hypothetical protein
MPLQQEELDKQKLAFMDTELSEISPWNDKGSLPYAYILKKDKNIEKCRPVVAYVDHPARKALRVAAKGGALVIRLLSQITKVKHFDLQDIARLAESMSDTNEDNDTVVLSAYDIQEMFTKLGKEPVLDAAWDMLMMVGNRLSGIDTGYYMLKGKQGPGLYR